MNNHSNVNIILFGALRGLTPAVMCFYRSPVFDIHLRSVNTELHTWQLLCVPMSFIHAQVGKSLKFTTRPRTPVDAMKRPLIYICEIISEIM